MSEINVLVVDDELDFNETIVKRLIRRKIKARGAFSGPQALSALDVEEADVIILDVKMPGMDGIEALREIKRRHPLVEVIMLTGHASVESGVQGMSLGAYDYIIKPADLDDLVEKIRQAHERRAINLGKN